MYEQAAYDNIFRSAGPAQHFIGNTGDKRHQTDSCDQTDDKYIGSDKEEHHHGDAAIENCGADAMEPG